MSFVVDTARSLFLLPNSYEYQSIRPHHVLILYGAASMVLKSKIVSLLKKIAVGLLSDVLEQMIPLAGYVPDCTIRWGIRQQLRHRLNLLQQHNDSCQVELDQKMAIVQELHTLPIAVSTQQANDQHYEVPAKFYDLCLGPCKKYSSGLWESSTTTLHESELAMLDLYCQRANVVDGMKIVDLGCGWGSLTLHLASKYPNCKITSISNSNSQREYIYKTAKERGYNVNNITVITCNVANDMGALDVVQDNDLVMTVEMFEHMKNYNDLMEKISKFLKQDGGTLFVHIFSHKDYVYHFEEGSWMSDNFFTGGTMPSDDLLLYFGTHFHAKRHWRVNGTHYYKTSNAWLHELDGAWKSGELKPVLGQAYGDGNEYTWYVNWRLFFLACAELFGLDHGDEWIVSHYLFEKR